MTSSDQHSGQTPPPHSSSRSTSQSTSRSNSNSRPNLKANSNLDRQPTKTRLNSQTKNSKTNQNKNPQKNPQNLYERSTNSPIKQIQSGNKAGGPPLRRRPIMPTKPSRLDQVAKITRLVAVICGAILLGTGLWYFSHSQNKSDKLSSPAAVTPNYQGFNAAKLISDEIFYNSAALDQTQIQQFISKINQGCQTGSDGTACLANWKATTANIDLLAGCKEPFTGAKDDTAAAVIFRAATACGVNPQVILVTAQKEQKLLTASGSQLNKNTYEKALGFGCQLGQECDTKWASFEKQVYGAAAQFARTRTEPNKFLYRSGQEYSIKYGQDVTCGAGKLKIANTATAALYNYTPYMASPDAINGKTGTCQNRANLDFYGIFHTWFGNPNPDDPANPNPSASATNSSAKNSPQTTNSTANPATPTPSASSK